ncbi:hypothetical protein Bbelb_101660 [Branchiostoma belcheri]|nr:hypothetical protein Bbelb_101660 [Branchiostoma belcheri]
MAAAQWPPYGWGALNGRFVQSGFRGDQLPTQRLLKMTSLSGAPVSHHQFKYSYMCTCPPHPAPAQTLPLTTPDLYITPLTSAHSLRHAKHMFKCRTDRVGPSAGHTTPARKSDITTALQAEVQYTVLSCQSPAWSTSDAPPAERRTLRYPALTWNKALTRKETAALAARRNTRRPLDVCAGG